MRTLLVPAALLLIGGSVAGAAPTATPAPSFARAKSYATGRAPGSVAIGDLNGDRKPDLATAGEDGPGRTVSVLLNRGNGSFRAKRDYATGSIPVSVAIGDLNGDGKSDLATANWDSGAVSVLLNTGDGAFQAKLDYTTGVGPDSVAIGDLNGDGKPDLATANVGTEHDPGRTVSVLLNRGDGSFQAKLDYTTGEGPDSVAIRDLNGDGKPDLATANFGTEHDPGRTVSVLLNRGDGSFRANRDYAAQIRPWSVAIGDLNGDRKPDLTTANNHARTVSVLLNKGDGTFNAKRDYGTRQHPESVAIGDLNGDGSPDLATANHGLWVHTVSVLLNKGDGTFQAKLDYGTGAFDSSVAIGDLNGDSKRDLVTADYLLNSVSVLLNTPGLCTVQNVRGTMLAAAKRAIARANCRSGTIRRPYSRTVKRGRVISQKPKFGAVLPGGSKVNLVVSLGRRS